MTRGELCREAIRLGRLLAQLMPDEPEVLGLLSLMLLTDARYPARRGGRLVVLAEQDRTSWDRGKIDEGQALLRRCLRRNQPGTYQLQAAINAVHCDAATVGDTDWQQVVTLYDRLLALAPSPIVALNRAVALAELHGAAAGLALLEELELAEHHRFHAVRAELLRRLGDRDGATVAYERAITLTGNATERVHLQDRLGQLRAADH